MSTGQRSNSRTLESQWELRLAVEPRSIEHVRRIFRAHLDYWGRAEVEFVALLGLTELLTNVLKHTEDKTSHGAKGQVAATWIRPWRLIR